MAEPVNKFSLTERDRRWALVRRLMAEQNLDILVAFPQWMVGDALYLADRAGAVLFPLERNPILVSPRAEPNPPADAWIRDVRPATSSGTTAVPYGKAVADCLKEMQLDGKRVAIAGLRGGRYTLVRQPEGYANFTSVDELRRALPKATIVDGTLVMTEARY